MVTLNKPAPGSTNWYQPVTDNWTTIENKLQLQLIEKKTVAAATQSVTFSSLDGDTDEFYVLQIYVINGSGSTMNIELRPNGLSTNLTYQVGTVSGGSFAGGSGGSGAIIDVTGSQQSYVTLFITASKTNAKPRFWHSNGIRHSGSGSLSAYFGAGVWNDTTTNITSLEVRSTVASGLGQNSILVLYRAATS